MAMLPERGNAGPGQASDLPRHSGLTTHFTLRLSILVTAYFWLPNIAMLHCAQPSNRSGHTKVVRVEAAPCGKVLDKSFQRHK